MALEFEEMMFFFYVIHSQIAKPWMISGLI